MREILRLCVELDSTACEVYAGMARACEHDADLHSVFSRMSKEEQQHVEWWTQLTAAWEGGLVPDILDEHDVLVRLAQVREGVERAVPERFESLTTDQMLDLAGRMEFFMLDSVFGELTDLMQPGGRIEAREAYSRHVLRIIDAIERRHSEQGLSAFLARALQRAYQDQQRLAALATLDQLTGQYNRRGFLGHLNQWLAWSARYGRPLALALVDIDYFKRINDSFGHPAGDDALVAVANCIAASVRTSDIVGRFGGDEFVVLAPEANQDDLARLMERMARAVRETPLLAGGEPVILSVSVGGAYIPGGIGVTAETLIAAADGSLYEAKGAGRDRAGVPIQAGPTQLA